MRSDFDFSPYYRATVGFDRVFDLLDSVASQTGATGYPPYNIEKADDDTYRIVMAVAGFSEAELNVTQKEGELLVNGKSQPAGHEKECLAAQRAEAPRCAPTEDASTCARHAGTAADV